MLLTGFEGYGGRGLNPAGEIVKLLRGERIAGQEIKGEIFPVSFGGLEKRMREAIRTHRPSAVICLGLWPGEQMIRLERFGLNRNDFEIPDNEGALRSDPIDVEGPTARAATLPVEEIRDRLLAAGIPARLSSSAGNFLCNATLYKTLGILEAKELEIPCGFIHVPYLPEQVAQMVASTKAEQRLELHQRGDLSSMSLETTVAAIRIAIETTLGAGK